MTTWWVMMTQRYLRTRGDEPLGNQTGIKCNAGTSARAEMRRAKKSWPSKWGWYLRTCGDEPLVSYADVTWLSVPPHRRRCAHSWHPGNIVGMVPPHARRWADDELAVWLGVPGSSAYAEMIRRVSIPNDNSGR